MTLHHQAPLTPKITHPAFARQIILHFYDMLICARLPRIIKHLQIMASPIPPLSVRRHRHDFVPRGATAAVMRLNGARLTTRRA